MISNNSNKRYRITATKDEKLGPEMLRIFHKINFRKMNNDIPHSFMITNFCQIFPDQWNIPLSHGKVHLLKVKKLHVNGPKGICKGK